MCFSLDGFQDHVIENKKNRNPWSPAACRLQTTSCVGGKEMVWALNGLPVPNCVWGIPHSQQCLQIAEQPSWNHGCCLISGPLKGLRRTKSCPNLTCAHRCSSSPWRLFSQLWNSYVRDSKRITVLGPLVQAISSPGLIPTDTPLLNQLTPNPVTTPETTWTVNSPLIQVLTVQKLVVVLFGAISAKMTRTGKENETECSRLLVT